MKQIFSSEQSEHKETESVRHIRNEGRSQTIFRVCVLDIDSRVFVGVIRNVSDSGAQIEVPDDFPHSGVLVYQHDLGSPCRARVVWSNGKFRGLSNIEVLEDKGEFSYFARDGAMRSLRIAVQLSSKSWLGQTKIIGGINNISQRGACISCQNTDNLSIGTLGTIEFGDFPSKTFSVRWISENEFGIRFEQPLKIIEFADLVARSQSQDA